jgi:Arc/MetJ-type ribon-helix-helix transcriptional regulator
MPEPTDPKVEALTERVTARLPDALLARIDTAVEEGTFPNRSAAIRTAVRDEFGGVRSDGDDRFLRTCEGCDELIDSRPAHQDGTDHASDCPIRQRRFPESLPPDQPDNDPQGGALNDE